MSSTPRDIPTALSYRRAGRGARGKRTPGASGARAASGTSTTTTSTRASFSSDVRSHSSPNLRDA